MRTQKRLVSILLVLAIAFSLLPTAALADGEVASAQQDQDGTDYYACETLADAVAHVIDGGKVRLLSSVSEDVTIPAGKAMTLDLNGQTLTGTVTNEGTLTVMDSLGGGMLQGLGSGYALTNHGTMVIGTENGENSFTINGGNTGSSLIENGWNLPGEGEAEAIMTIYGGSFTGGLNNIKNDEYGNLTIYDCTCTGAAQWAVQNWAKAAIHGGSFKTTAKFSAHAVKCEAGSTTTITGGSFSAPSNARSVFAATGSTVKISGGKYFPTKAGTTNFISSLLVSKDYYVSSSSESGLYPVLPYPLKTNYTNASGTTYVSRYKSLSDAISGVKGKSGTNKSVILLTDYTGNGTFPTGYEMTLYLNGKTLTQPAGKSYAVSVKGTVTLRGPGNLEGCISLDDAAATLTLANGAPVPEVKSGIAGKVVTESGGTYSLRDIVYAQSVEMNEEAITLPVGGTQVLSATVLPDNADDATVTWSSDHPEIAAVDEATGEVTGIVPGEATITASAAGVADGTDPVPSAECVVTVKVPVTAVTISGQPDAPISVGETVGLTASVAPDEATYPAVTWSSSNEEAAVVDESGVVTGMKAGEAVITASADGVSDACTIQVKHEHTTGAWLHDAASHWKECTDPDCDETAGTKLFTQAHTFGAWSTTQEPSTTENGSAKRVCSECGYEETKTIPVLRTFAITSNVTNGMVVTNLEPDNGSGVVIGPKPGPNPAKAGETVVLVLAPNQGYHDADIQLYYSYDNVVSTEIHYVTITVLDAEVISFSMPDADVAVTGTFKPIEYQITYNLDGGTNSDANPSTYTVEKGFDLTAPTKSGYTFLGWSFNNNPDIMKAVTIKDGSTGDITFTAHWNYRGSTAGGGGGGSSASTTTEKNPDGSTTTITTDKTTGTVTEVTKNTDGSTTTVETKKDGTVTETNKAADGTTGTVITDKNGDVTEVKSTVSTQAATEAAKIGDAVTLPVEVPAAKNTEDAPAVQVTVPKSAGSVKVEIPVEKVTPGTVAVIVKADGTEEIVSTSVVTENGVALTLDGSATVKVIDNSKDFIDVPETNVFYNEISSLSAREIMVGKTEDFFDLHNDVTLNQVANVAGRITGAVDVKDFNAGIVWGNENGLKTGNEAATRGEVLKALYVAAGSPAVADTSIVARFNDVASIPADMAAIVAWAAQNGILKGTDAGNADLNVYVTRGQACALASRTMGTLA